MRMKRGLSEGGCLPVSETSRRWGDREETVDLTLGDGRTVLAIQKSRQSGGWSTAGDRLLAGDRDERGVQMLL